MPGEKSKAVMVFSKLQKLSGSLASIHFSVGIFIAATLLALRYSASQIIKVPGFPFCHYVQSQHLWIHIQSFIQKDRYRTS